MANAMGTHSVSTGLSVAMLSCRAGVEETLAKCVSVQSLLGKRPAEL